MANKPNKCSECSECYEVENEENKVIGHCCFINLEDIENVDEKPVWCPWDVYHGNENE